MPHLAVLRKNELPFGKRVLTIGSEGRDVQYLQTVLNKLGIYNGDYLGHYDLLTMEAVKTFQKAYYLSADGITGPDTSKLLMDPSIHNRLFIQPVSGGTLAELATEYGVGLPALKDPAGRRRLQKLEPQSPVIIEKREIILELSLGTKETTRAEDQPTTNASANTLHLLNLEEIAVQKQRKILLMPQSRLIISSTSKRAPRFLRKTSRQLQLEGKTEIIWWLNSETLLFPQPGEADGLLYSPQSRGIAAHGRFDWKEIRKILYYYPCTRLLVHFDLRGRGKTVDGRERLLTAYESRIARINRISNPRRVAENGWVYYRYKLKAEEREAFLPDLRTIRGVLHQIDHYNLRGVLFTGIEEWEEGIKEESNRFFQANLRILVMNNRDLA